MLNPTSEQVDGDQAGIVSSVTSRLDKIVKALGHAEEATFLIGQDQTTHVKMRLKSLLISADNAGATIITLKIGTRSYIYNVVGPITLVVPPPATIIDRGVDVTCLANTGNVTLAYFRYTAE
jgi:hypothetical protein